MTLESWTVTTTVPAEMSIVIHTDDPSAAFDWAKSLIQGRNGLEQLTAGYRDFDDDD
jgi:hypothetical protein